MASAYLLDNIGRRRNLIFFAAGIPASLGALFNELYPRGIRGTGVDFCCDFGCVVSAGFPVLVGHMSGSEAGHRVVVAICFTSRVSGR